MKVKNRKKCTVNGESFFTFTKFTWVANSGASSHMTNDDSSLKNLEIINDLFHSALGTIIAMEKRMKKVHVMQTDGSVKNMTLYLVKYCKDSMSNLLSQMSMLLDSWMLMTMLTISP